MINKHISKGFSMQLLRVLLGLALQVDQLFEIGLDYIPPVTRGVVGLNFYLYLIPVAPLMQVCVSVQKVYWHGEWRRLLLSPFHHVDGWHLYFNLTSFLWKGINLERRMGGAWFLYVLSVFVLLTGLVYLALQAGLTRLTDDQSYSTQCAVGFSGVLFALKVLIDPECVTYTIWVELVLTHFLIPRSSLIGHLAGILVGLLYTAGPLKFLF